MALTANATRSIITEDTPMAVPLEFKTHAAILLQDIEAIQHQFHSSGPYILTAHAIELMLKGYLKGVAALSRQRKEEDYGHDIDRLLNEAKKAGLKFSDPDTDELVQKLANAIRDTRLRYVFPFEDLPIPPDCLRVARALQKDIGQVVKAETTEETQERRAAETAKREYERTRKTPFPG